MAGKLLLVDDDRFILNALEKLFKREGYVCTTAINVEDARRALASEEFDLMLLDVGLPDQDGLSFCGKARASEWIFEQVWGYDAELGMKTLTVYVRRLRRKIEPDPDNPRYLVTVRGFGYKLAAPEDS